MKTIEHQKSVALKILRKLETFDPTCILAGGAPRDWYFGNLATDLDFYVYFRPDLQRWFLDKQLASLGLTCGIKGDSEFPENYKRNPYLRHVYEGRMGGEVYQIMFMSEPTFHTVVPLFPFGICQAWWKGDEIFTSLEFDKSVRHKVLYLLNYLYSDADGYIQKIKNKFPDYLFLGKL